MQNFVPFWHHILPAVPPLGPLQWRSHGATLKWKKRGCMTFFVLLSHLQIAFATSLENGFTKWRAAAKIFPSKESFVNVKEKLESVYSKLKDGSGFELLSSKLALINTLAGRYSVPFLRDAVARHWPISGHSKWTWTRQWLKVLSSLSSYVFRTPATNKISWTVQPKPTCKHVNWLYCGEVGALPIMTYTGQSPFQAFGIKNGRNFTSWSIWQGREICPRIFVW